jgi:hypothetical protein
MRFENEMQKFMTIKYSLPLASSHTILILLGEQLCGLGGWGGQSYLKIIIFYFISIFYVKPLS